MHVAPGRKYSGWLFTARFAEPRFERRGVHHDDGHVRARGFAPRDGPVHPQALNKVSSIIRNVKRDPPVSVQVSIPEGRHMVRSTWTAARSAIVVLISASVCHPPTAAAPEADAGDGVDRALEPPADAITTDAQFAPPHREMGLANCRKGERPAALASLECCTALDPKAEDATPSTIEERKRFSRFGRTRAERPHLPHGSKRDGAESQQCPELAGQRKDQGKDPGTEAGR